MMKTFKILFTFIVGFSILSIWAMLYLTGNIPELQSEPIRIIMHISAEITTAILLIVSGLAMIKNSKIAGKVFLFSLGLLCYTLIASPGYYLDKGEPGMVIMFAVLFCITLFLLIRELKIHH